MDKEGGVQATESKTRFIGTAVALMISRRAADNDPVRGPGGAITGQSSNVGGRTLGGGMGFGLLGAVAAQSSRTVGAAFGYYGLAWSVYSTVVKRGAEVQFGRNAVIDIGFNQRTPAGSTHQDGAAHRSDEINPLILRLASDMLDRGSYKSMISGVSSASSLAYSQPTQAAAPQPPAKQPASSPQDSVHLSGAKASGDADHDGDSK